MTSDAAVVVLAGGEGSRIGGAKAQLRLGGKRLIDRALEQARSWSDLIAVAVKDEAQVLPVDAVLITDEPQLEGPLGGLVAALRFAREQRRELLLAIPADTPFLPLDLLDRLRSVIADADCALASSGGRLHPVCGLWRTSALDSADAYISTGKRSLNGFAAAVGFAKVDWSADPQDPFFNLNSPADLAAAEARLAR